ncbi:erythromycin esterase family protein [Virgibacillus proomii]|uniref:erythromycin esterase family protein n=1 Tax=Virgibacillus proomii TaxID=84407 RepID=UPI001C103DD7|nr:erythromycin esterase family protein [Virgibacillus proomii]MBU5267927.1 erythromycin esterase family protein [Virgibacillus proomii]
MDLEQLNEELNNCKDVFEKKKVIFLGENGHGVSEIQKLKIKMIEYLHEHFGFNKIVFESGIGEIAIANHYKYHLSTKEFLMNSLYDVWHTKELFELFKIIQNRELTIFGMDIQYQNHYFHDSIFSIIENYDHGLANDFSYAEKTLDTISARIFMRKKMLLQKNRLDLIYCRVYILLKDMKKEIMLSQDICETTYTLILKAIENRMKILELCLMNFKMYSYYRDKYMFEHLSFLVNKWPEDKFIVWAHKGWLNEKSLGEFYSEKHKDSYHLGIYMKEGIIANNIGTPYKIKRHKKNSLENNLFSKNNNDIILESFESMDHQKWYNNELIEHESGEDKRKLIVSEQYDGIIGIRHVTPAKYINT